MELFAIGIAVGALLALLLPLLFRSGRSFGNLMGVLADGRIVRLKRHESDQVCARMSTNDYKYLIQLTHRANQGQFPTPEEAAVAQQIINAAITDWIYNTPEGAAWRQSNWR